MAQLVILPLPDAPVAESHLDDSRYRELLEQRTNLDLTLSILAYTILTEREYIPDIEEFLDLPSNCVIGALAGLAPVVACETATTGNVIVDDDFVDFLLEKTRSAEFHIDWDVWHARFAHHYFERIRLGAHGAHKLRLIIVHLQNIKASQELYQDILSFEYTLDHISYLSHASENLWDEVSNFLSQIKGLMFDDNDAAYNLQRDRMTSLLARDFKAFRGQLISLANANHLNDHPITRLMLMKVERGDRKRRTQRVFWNKSRSANVMPPRG